jgi:uncharacterized protein (DUF1810 family)
MADFELERFVEAQTPIYGRALAELQQGRKESHWMWFVFPQVAGLGSSPAARRYAIASVAEARAYIAHIVLGPRLYECTQAVLRHRGLGADAIFGPVDALKLRSSMTLFEAAADDPRLFAAVLTGFYGGERDGATLRRLAP